MHIIRESLWGAERSVTSTEVSVLMTRSESTMLNTIARQVVASDLSAWNNVHATLVGCRLLMSTHKTEIHVVQ
jgi:hypothetical protein